MGGTYNLQPSGDWRNDGWTLTGASSLNAAWSSTSDTVYASSPASKGVGTVSFPQDTTGIPAGAIITSVSVMIRCSTGMGSPPAGVPASVTVSDLCADNTSAFTSQTIYPTSSPATYTVASYTQDPLGEKWDVHRLNQLLLRVFSYVSVAACINVHELYAAVNYRSAPVVSITAPIGTQNTAAPVVGWTYTQVDGDAQVEVEYRIFTAAQVAQTGFSPDTSTPVFEFQAEGDFNSRIIPSALPSNTYQIYLRSTSQFGAVSAWDSRQFTLNAPAPGTPGVDNPADPPGQAIVSIVPDPVQGMAVLTLQNTSNAVGTGMASIQGNVDGVTWTTSNCSMTQSTDYCVPGGTGYSWKMAPAASGNMTATTGYEAVPASTAITMSCEVFGPTSGRTVSAQAQYFDDDYNPITTTAGISVVDSATTWTLLADIDTTPSNAAYVQLTITVTGVASGENHYVDRIGIMFGTNTPWSSGGQMSTNLLSAWYSNCEGAAPAGDAWVPGPATSVGTSGPVGAGGFDGTTCNEMTYTGIASSINAPVVGSTFTSTASSTAYTLNKPTGTVQGWLMLAFVTSVQSSSITPPAGWELIDSAVIDDGSTDSALFVLARTAGPAEPATWSGTLSVATNRTSAVVLGYSGAADLSLQFIDEASIATPNSLSVFTSQAVANTDPGAWRVSAFMASDPGAAGTFTANTQPPAPGPEAFVSAAPAWNSDDNNSSFTINRPPNLQQGDLMIATLAADSFGGAPTAPTGWTMVQSVTGSFTQDVGTYAIMTRTAGAAEPSSWTGSLAGLGGTPPTYPKNTNCVAYRNCALASSQFVAQSANIAEAASGTGANGTTIYTPSVTNTNASAWRVTAFLATTEVYGSWSGGDTALRVNSSAQDPHTGAVTAAFFDSNGPVATGSYGKYASCSSNWDSAVAWEAFLAPLPSPGTPPANETNRVALNAGTANPWDVLAVFDSNGPVTAGSSSVTGVYSRTFQSAASWVGIIRPSTPAVAGLVSAGIELPVDISQAAPEAPTLAGNQVTLLASMIGSSAGQCLLTALFYRANVLIGQVTQSGGTFNSTTGTWTPCSATFDMPTGTTRVGMSLGVPDRAIGDVAYWDRAGINLGPDPTYRVGTSQPAHPIWSYPEIQCADSDGTGYGPWQDVPGTQTNVPSFGEDQLLVFQDHTIVPLLTRKYRARTVTYGLAGDVFTSPWGPDSDPVSFVSQNWWLKDISDPANNILLKVKWGDLQVQLQGTAVQFQALGEQYPVLITQGFKSDTFTLKLVPVDQDDFALLVDLLTTNNTYFLQSDIDKVWWVQPLGNISNTILATADRQSNPLRELDITFLEVGPVA